MTKVNALAVTGFFLCLAAAPAASADPALDRVVDAAKASAVIPDETIEKASATCATALCFAEALAAELPGKALLEPVTHPDTDTIRWAKTTASVIANSTKAPLTLKLTHFGRKAVAELREALAPSSLLVDLRGNPGGDFERMLEIAGLLIGSRRDAIAIDYGDRVERRSLEGPRSPPWRVTRVEIDEKTASAALLLARLLKAHTNAEVAGPRPVVGPLPVVGPRVNEKPIFLKRRIPIDHDWRLVLPIAEIRVTAPLRE